MLDARVLLADRHANAQLFHQLARERRPLALARFDLAAGKLPQRGALALGPPERHQHLAVPLDHRGDDKDPLHGKRPSENSVPSLERMKATPGTTSARCEKPLPGSNAPRASPVCASMPMSGPRSRATMTRPLIAAGCVGNWS